MKYFIAVLAIFLLISSTFERRVSRINRKFRSHNRFLDFKDSPVYQFILGLVKEIASDDSFNQLIDNCTKGTPLESVKTVDPDPKEKEVASDNSVAKSFAGNLVAKAIDACCNFKEWVIGTVTKTYKRYFRFFMQGKIRKKKLLDFSFSDIWEGVKQSAKIVEFAVTHHDRIIGGAINYTIDWAQKEIDDAVVNIKDYFYKQFEPILKSIREWFEKKFRDFLEKHPTLKLIVDFAKCFANEMMKNSKSNVAAVQKIIKVFSSVIGNIGSLFSGSGIISLIVNAVCGWRLIVRGFDYLGDADKAQNALTKANYRGCATADFLLVIAGESTLSDDEKAPEKMRPRLIFADKK